MRKILRISALLAILALSGCAYGDMVCRHKAVAAATVAMERGDDCRLVVYEIDSPDPRYHSHMQAAILDKGTGEWLYLSTPFAIIGMGLENKLYLSRSPEYQMTGRTRSFKVEEWISILRDKTLTY